MKSLIYKILHFFKGFFFFLTVVLKLRIGKNKANNSEDNLDHIHDVEEHQNVEKGVSDEKKPK